MGWWSFLVWSLWVLSQVLWWFLLPFGKRPLDYWRRTWLQLNMPQFTAQFRCVNRQWLLWGGRTWSSFRPCPIMSLWLLPEPLCSLLQGSKMGAGTRGLLQFSEQSQVTPGPWKRKTAGAVNSLVFRVLLCSNRNENSPSGNSHL